jgi:hypothetical protein
MQNSSLNAQSIRSFLRTLQSLAEIPCPTSTLAHLQKYLLSEGRWEFATYTRQLKKIEAAQQRNFVSSLNQGQVESKIWLFDVLKDVLPPGKYDFHFAGGWTGLTSLIGIWLYPELIKHCHSFDIDPDCEPLATLLNKPFSFTGEFSASTLDITDFPYAPHKPSILVNTICEHLPDFKNWYGQVPAGQFLVLQSNNLFSAEGHVNCVENLNNFIALAPMSTCLFSGELELFDYKRFMLIGVK